MLAEYPAACDPSIGQSCIRSQQLHSFPTAAPVHTADGILAGENHVCVATAVPHRNQNALHTHYGVLFGVCPVYIKSPNGGRLMGCGAQRRPGVVARAGSGSVLLVRERAAPRLQNREPEFRINVTGKIEVGLSDVGEVRDWCNEFDCSEQELEAIVLRVGSFANDVKAELSRG